MKNRSDNMLLVTFLVSLAFYGFVLASYLELISWDNPRWMYTIYNWLALCFHAVPVFCLQFLLCRKTRLWVAALPSLAILGVALWFTYGFLSNPGWDTLGYAILMVLCIAPVVGCVLAWVVYGSWTLYQKNHQ